MIITPATLTALLTGFNTQFQAAFDTAPSHYTKIAMVVNSTTKKETYGWLGKSTGFREWVGDRVLQNIEAHGYTIDNKSFENTVTVDRDDIEDDTIGVYGPLFSQLGMDAKVHPDQLAFGLLKGGLANKGYDGQYFFDTDHPAGQTTASNYSDGGGTAWYLLDTSRAVKPVIFQKRKDYKFIALDNEQNEAAFMRKQYRYGVDARVNVGYGLWQLAYCSTQPLSQDNYAEARAAMMGLVNDNGQPMGITPNLLVAPPSLEMQARTLLNAELISDGGAGGNTNIYRNSAELLVTPWVI